MQKFIKRRVLATLILAAMSVPALADQGDPPGEFAMAGDMLVARPIGVVVTAAGTALFLVSLPFTAIAGGVEQAANTLVVGPAKETFVRCLGCPSSGRYTDPNDVSR